MLITLSCGTDGSGHSKHRELNLSRVDLFVSAGTQPSLRVNWNRWTSPNADTSRLGNPLSHSLRSVNVTPLKSSRAREGTLGKPHLFLCNRRPNLPNLRFISFASWSKSSDAKPWRARAVGTPSSGLRSRSISISRVFYFHLFFHESPPFDLLVPTFHRFLFHLQPITRSVSDGVSDLLLPAEEVIVKVLFSLFFLWMSFHTCPNF